MRIAPKHSVRVNDDEKPYCLLCGAEGKELMEECTDDDPLDFRKYSIEYDYELEHELGELYDLPNS
jgi:hypothetical protein